MALSIFSSRDRLTRHRRTSALLTPNNLQESRNVIRFELGVVTRDPSETSDSVVQEGSVGAFQRSYSRDEVSSSSTNRAVYDPSEQQSTHCRTSRSWRECPCILGREAWLWKRTRSAGSSCARSKLAALVAACRLQLGLTGRRIEAGTKWKAAGGSQKGTSETDLSLQTGPEEQSETSPLPSQKERREENGGAEGRSREGSRRTDRKERRWPAASAPELRSRALSPSLRLLPFTASLSRPLLVFQLTLDCTTMAGLAPITLMPSQVSVGHLHVVSTR